MKKKIQANSLIIEVTQRCNLACEHCLRGCSRNVDLKKSYVDSLLDQVDTIGSVVFTGGEPTLNLPIIEYVFDEIRRRDIPLGFFWLATNGVEKSLELATLLLKNIDLCTEQELMGVAISMDVYHDVDTRGNLLRFLSFYDYSKEWSENSYDRPLIAMGYAEENQLGGRDYHPKENISIIDVYNDIIQVEEIYLRANGEIVADCDISYDLADEMAICRVEDLTQFLENQKEELAA